MAAKTFKASHFKKKRQASSSRKRDLVDPATVMRWTHKTPPTIHELPALRQRVITTNFLVIALK